MPISKKKALELIDQKIEQFQHILDTATYDTRYDTEYHEAYYGTESLIAELFSGDEVKKFRLDTSTIFGGIVASVNYERELRDYKEHISKCISQLKVYKERIQNFWEDQVSNEPVIVEPGTNEHIINWSILRKKVQSLWNSVKGFWKVILAILGFLVLIGGASEGIKVITGLLNSTK